MRAVEGVTRTGAILIFTEGEAEELGKQTEEWLRMTYTCVHLRVHMHSHVHVRVRACLCVSVSSHTCLKMPRREFQGRSS